jgi:signal transduction histidine kinase
VSSYSKHAYLLKLVGLFAIYFATAKLGLRLGAVSGFATLIWPPAGIALAAVLLSGHGVWPAIFAGAFFANLSTGAPLWVACGLGAGNTLEALCGAYLLVRFVGFSNRLDRLKDALGLIFFAAAISTMLSATIGVSCLTLGGVVQAERFWPTWNAWWAGDALGNLVVAPLILVYATQQWPRLSLLRILESAGLLAGFLAASLLVFGRSSLLPVDHPPLTYVVFPFVIWASLRFGVLGAVSSTFLLSVVTVYHTALGAGPFARSTLSESLFYLVTFQAVIAITGIILAAVVAERRRALDDLFLHQEELRGALQTRDEFLSIASHELKTPVTSLLLQLQLLGKNLSRHFALPEGRATPALPTPEKLASAVDLCIMQGKKLAVLLNELLDLTRIRTGKLSLSLESIQLSSVVLEVVERQKVSATKAGSSISVKTDASLVGNWDRMRLEQIVTNLLSNAIKYGDGKPIEILTEGDPQQKVARLVIKDHGIGISQDLRAKVFEPYERAISSEEQNISGLGLGLYITRQIVEAHQGAIDFQSQIGQGSAFTVTLPVATA